MNTTQEPIDTVSTAQVKPDQPMSDEQYAAFWATIHGDWQAVSRDYHTLCRRWPVANRAALAELDK